MEIVAYNGNTLAYVGDAVMSLLVREMLVAQGCQKPKVLQHRSEAWVSARAQANFLEILQKEGFFDEVEKSIVARGRNAKSYSVAKNASVAAYRMATGLEAVFGYLQLCNKQERLAMLWMRIQEIGEQS